jgi:cryptochrome
LFPKLFEAWNVTHLVFEKDTDAYARQRDEFVIQAAKDSGVQVITKYGRTLWDSDDIVKMNHGKPTMSITQLRASGEKVGDIAKPIPAPTKLPDPGEMPIDFEHIIPKNKLDGDGKWREKRDSAYIHIAGPDGDFAVETLEELGYSTATTPHRGGETIALQRLDKMMADQKYIATFRKPQTSPAAFEPPSTTLMSAFLHFGALSVRTFYWSCREVLDAYTEKGKKDASSPPESLIGQLLFRDMYFAAQAAIGAPFTQTAFNGYCRFVPWHLPSKLDPDTKMATLEYEIDSQQAEIWFQRWKAGMTGFPWIDALMRQLREEGWIHHLGRHSVACFLTRGGCYIHWERGAAVFEELLIDHEPACNAGNWQWLSCTAFFSQYHRCYSPIAFGRKWDPDGDFVRLWVPELRNLDKKYIYEPWKTPIADQKKAGVRVVQIRDHQLDDMNLEQGTYPKPMFDFDERKGICMAAMKKAYDAGLYGDDERVTNSGWRAVFDETLDMDMRGGRSHGNISNIYMESTSRRRTRQTDTTGQHLKQASLDGHIKKKPKTVK